jgi:polysaccharide pyruvyl transferase WcaK-like protein
MIVEITGIGYPNKGAELMLCAAAEQVLTHWGDDVIVATEPTLGHDLGYRALASYGCHQRASLIWKGLDLGTPVGNLLPKRLLRSYGVVAEKEIDVVLDASGLRYTDRWGPKTLQNALRHYTRIKRRGGKVILLPQAFGPFENPVIREDMKRLHALVDRIYARDAVSYEFLTAAVGESEKIVRGSDFTALVKGETVSDIDQFAGKIGIIPNQRMLDKTDTATANGYFDLLTFFAQRCRENGQEVFVLNHEGAADDKICGRLVEAFEPNLPYTGIRTAKEIKGIIGTASGMLTSRFHGLVSALSQGVPVLATSWSHKYEEMMDHYGLENSILDSSRVGGEAVRLIVDQWFDHLSVSNNDLRTHLLERAFTEKADINKMWLDVYNLVLD